MAYYQGQQPQTLYHGQQQPQHKGVPEYKKQRVLNILSILVALGAGFEVFGISGLFAFTGMSNDDAEEAFEGVALAAFFDPVGLLIMVTLLIAAFIIHAISKRMPRFSNAMTRTGLITTVVFFVFSFFRISTVLSMFVGAAGAGLNMVQNEADVRTPTAEEFTLDEAQLIQYRGDDGIRIMSALTNNGEEHWESATVSVTYSNAEGTACGREKSVENFMSPGETRAITTKFLTAAIYYDDPSCVPATVAAELVSIDVDSRSEIVASDYERRAPDPGFVSLALIEEPWIMSSPVKLSIAGTVAQESMDALIEGERLPVGFEAVDHQGLRLNWCFKPDEVTPDGSFTTREFHSPIDPGTFASVAVVPEC
jgi:hypothetical protein